MSANNAASNPPDQVQPAVHPAVQPIIIQNQVAAPVAESGGGSRWVLYLSLGFITLLIMYVSVVYTQDLKNRNDRNRRYNLEAYAQYSMVLANRNPKGHNTNQILPKWQDLEEDDSGVSESEEWSDIDDK